MDINSEQTFQYKMVTSLKREEVIRRLKNATVMKGEWVPFHDREKYLFRGEVEEESFMIRINPLLMSPYSPRNSFLPMIQGVILTGTDGNCGILFQLKNMWHWKSKSIWVFRIFFSFWCVAMAFGSLCFLIEDPLGETVWILFWCLVLGLGALWKRTYWKRVGKSLVKWFEELWDAREVV